MNNIHIKPALILSGVLAGLVTIPFPLWAADCAPHLPPEEQYKIEAQTGGLLLRQPVAEEQWKALLAGEGEGTLPHGKESKMLPQAQTLDAQSKKQLGALIDTYKKDIMAQLEKELSTKGIKTPLSQMETLAKSNQPQGEYSNRKLYIFVSSSMPMGTLHNLIGSMSGSESVMVIRGLVGEDAKAFLPTQEWVQEVLCSTKTVTAKAKCEAGPLDIHPMLFRAMGIEQVPAVAYVPDPSVLGGCQSGEQLAAHQYLLYYGDMPLSYILRQFQQQRPMDMDISKLISHVSGKGGKGIGGTQHDKGIAMPGRTDKD